MKFGNSSNFKPEVVIKTKTLWTVVLLALVCLVIVGCAHPNPMKGHGNGPQSVAGFFAGLWHGFTFIFSLIGSLFSSKFTMYEVYNMGFPYNLGFVLGQLLFLGAGAVAEEMVPVPKEARRRQKRRQRSQYREIV